MAKAPKERLAARERAAMAAPDAAAAPGGLGRGRDGIHGGGQRCFFFAPICSPFFLFCPFFFEGWPSKKKGGRKTTRWKEKAVEKKIICEKSAKNLRKIVFWGFPGGNPP